MRGTIQVMKDESISNWLESLARKQPTPGGGAAAALAAATASALVGMVSNYTTGPKWSDREVRMKDIAHRASELRQQSLSLAEADATAFALVGAAYTLPSTTDEETQIKRTAIESALMQAAKPPTETIAVVAEIISLAKELIDSGNPNVLSDVAVAASFAHTAVESAIVNVQINESSMKNKDNKALFHKVIAEAEPLLAQADNIVASVRMRIAS